MKTLRKTLLAFVVLVTMTAAASTAQAQPGGPSDDDPATTGEIVERSAEIDPNTPAANWATYNPEPYTAYAVTDAGIPGGTAAGWLLADTVIEGDKGCDVYVAGDGSDDQPHGFPGGAYTVFGNGYEPPTQLIHYMRYNAGERIKIRIHEGDYYVIGVGTKQLDHCRFQFHHRPAGFYEPTWDNGDPFNPGPTIVNTGEVFLPPPGNFGH